MTTKSLLLVEDDPSIQRLVTFLLENEGFDVTASLDAANARQQLDAGTSPDLVLMDLMLPDQDGVDFGRELRGRSGFERVPIVALSARDQAIDKYEAYKAGFDGYVTKPFDPLELVYSIRAFLRLASPSEDGPAPDLGPEGFRLSPPKFTVIAGGQEITLTRLETAVLHHLMKHPREVFSAEQLSDTVLLNAHGKTRTVDAVHAHIRNLRTKLEPDPKNPTWIKTMGRRGYYFAG